MIHPLIKTTVFSLITVLCAQTAWAEAMEAGAWQMDSKITMQDVKTGQSKTMNESTSKYCLTPAFIAKDAYLTPGLDKAKMEEKKAKCSISDEKKSPGAASWRMNCKTQDGHEVDALISNTASAQKMTSNVEQVVSQGGKTVKLNIAMNGKFIGKCSKEMPEL
ncbi:MAG: DUF3617 family protein [Gammaproteobacteria bacterium]|nr:DUF3617 family protein [Gammaproteobacteria bacterium]